MWDCREDPAERILQRGSGAKGPLSLRIRCHGILVRVACHDLLASCVAGECMQVCAVPEARASGQGLSACAQVMCKGWTLERESGMGWGAVVG